MASNNNHNTINIKNRKATFDYEIIETFTTGIVLTGTEIKSIRQGKCGLTDTYCMVINGEIWVKNMYIAEYSYGSYNNHTTHRDRKLLLNRKEIRRIARDTQQPGIAIVPLRLFINERGLPVHQGTRGQAHHRPHVQALISRGRSKHSSSPFIPLFPYYYIKSGGPFRSPDYY